MKYKEGDFVNLLPYDAVIDHHGIFEESWNRLVESNPNQILYIRNGKIFMRYGKNATLWVKEKSVEKYCTHVYDIESLI